MMRKYAIILKGPWCKLFIILYIKNIEILRIIYHIKFDKNHITYQNIDLKPNFQRFVEKSYNLYENE